MNKHTPGPWHVIERANGQAFSIGCQVQTKGNFITTHYIANVTDGATPQDKYPLSPLRRVFFLKE